MTELPWDPCFVDRSRGVAFFDGIVIESDPIGYTHKKRVLPILEEEQVQMCRLLRRADGPLQRLEQGSLCLDVGTGSGVFAVQAAKHGMRSIAIDINERALRFALANAKRNGLEARILEPTEVDPTTVPEVGEILLINHRFGETTASLCGDKLFHAIFLSPPYNPTYGAISAPLHASAGQLGQEIFQEQLPTSLALLRPGGVVVGNQMGLWTESEESIIRDIRDHTGGLGFTLELNYCHLLTDDPHIPVSDFLSAQYKDILRRWARKGESSRVEELENWIKTFRAESTSFSFIYFEAWHANRPKSEVAEISGWQTPPKKNWQDRILLHREIVNNSQDSNWIPAPDFVLDSISVPPLLLEPDSNPDASNELATRLSLPIRSLDLWVLEKNLVGGSEDSQFELVVIDTAPYHGFVDRQDLVQECAAWTNGQDGHLGVDVVNEWQQHTSAMQQSESGLYLHPSFTGESQGENWREILESVRSRMDASNAEISDRVKTIQENIAGAATPAWSLDEIRSGVGYSTTPLLNLLPETESEEDPNRSPSELENRHLAMHASLDSHIQSQRGVDWHSSILISVPIGIGYSVFNEEAGTPETYRGAIWIYARSNSSIGFERLKAIKNFGRFAWLLFNAKYNLDATRAAERQSNAIKDARIPTAILNLRNELPRNLEDFAWETRLHEFLQPGHEKSLVEKLPTIIRDIYEWFVDENGEYQDKWAKNFFKAIIPSEGTSAIGAGRGLPISIIKEALPVEVQFDDIDSDSLISMPVSPEAVPLFLLAEFLNEWKADLNPADRNPSPKIVFSRVGRDQYCISIPMRNADHLYSLLLSREEGGGTTEALRALLQCRTKSVLNGPQIRRLGDSRLWPEPPTLGKNRHKTPAVLITPIPTEGQLKLVWEAN